MEAVSPHVMGVALTVAGVLLGLVWVLLRIRSELRPNPPLNDLYASKTALQAVADDVDELSADLSDLERKFDEGFQRLSASQREQGDRAITALREMDARNEARVEKVHERVNDILREVSRLHGRSETGGPS